MTTKNNFHLVGNLKAFKTFLLLAAACTLLCACIPSYPTPIPCGDTGELIQAIIYANSDPTTMDVIELDAGCTYSLDAAYETGEGATGLPAIETPIRIIGNGAEIIRRDDPSIEKFRIFFVSTTGELELIDLTLKNGYAFYPDDTSDVERNAGGAIRNTGMTYLNEVTIEHNTAYGVTGGIFNQGELVIKASTLRWNEQEGNAYAMGGATAVHNRMGTTASIISSTISENGLSGIWNAVTNSETSDMYIENSTFSGNSGTAINNDGNLDLMYVTLAGNQLGIWSVWYGIPKINMTGTLFQNTMDCNIGNNVLVSNYYNMDSDGTCNATYTVSPANMLLDGLADNGGGTETHALLAGSPAIDAVTGPASRVCTIVEDQRGITRPMIIYCDIGAYEYQGSNIAPVPNQNDDLAPLFTETPTPTATLAPTPTFTLTPTPEETRCDLFDGETATLTMLDIPYGTTDLTLYVQFSHPIWGWEAQVEGNVLPWNYAATLGTTTAFLCYYPGYAGRLYCDFDLPEAAMGATLPLYVYINGCDEPIYANPRVSIFEPTPPCSVDLGQNACAEAGGTYNARQNQCDCP